ncbi:DUF7660 family protein [Streptomyces niger]|uniref:DUF7660 family protein n=1 Tax=Streptomyces niger TaxID=66373 RepID=UPI0018FEF44A|nr:hypothetical protein [Streptomyces niger]
MELWQKVEGVSSMESLADFLQSASEDFKNNAENWENRDLESFLEAMSAWIADSEAWFERRGLPLPSEEAWALVANAVMAASMYE